MRLQTTSPNDASFAAGDKFACNKAPQVILTMATKEESRIMSLHDEYTELNLTAAATVTAPANANGLADSSEDVVVNVKDAGANNLANKVVTAASANTAVATVSPVGVITDASGNATFTITRVAAGGPINVTFTCDAASDTTSVTVT